MRSSIADLIAGCDILLGGYFVILGCFINPSYLYGQDCQVTRCQAGVSEEVSSQVKLSLKN